MTALKYWFVFFALTFSVASIPTVIETCVLSESEPPPPPRDFDECREQAFERFNLCRVDLDAYCDARLDQEMQHCRSAFLDDCPVPEWTYTMRPK